MTKDRHDNVEERDAGYAEHRAAAEEIPGRKVGKSRSYVVRITLDQQVVSRAVDDQCNQRRDEGAQAQVAYQEAIYGAKQHPGHDGREHNERYWPAEHIKSVKSAEVG
jgi:hypothetical protein